MHILRARLPRDTDTIRALWNAYGAYLRQIDCYECGGETIAPELEDLERYYPKTEAGIYLAMEDTTPVGTIAFNRINDNTAEIRRLYVLPEHEGKNIGSALLEHAIAEIRKHGYSRILLDTFRSQEKPHYIYKKLGFRACEAYNDSPVDKTLFMERVL